MAALTDTGGNPSVWVCLPTYNEAENLPQMVDQLLIVFDRHAINGQVLVIDDDSPDGTGRIADEIAAREARVAVLHRPARQGLGRAYRDGFQFVLDRGADLIVEMDCDFSHDPSALPSLLEAAKGADVVLGSRYIAGGATENWGLTRRLVSRGGCAYARLVLGIEPHDLTGGFKCFRRGVLEEIPLGQVGAAGYVFQVEMTYRAILHGFRVAEVPILFRDRTAGSSKMSHAIVLEAAVYLPWLRWTLRQRRRQS